MEFQRLDQETLVMEAYRSKDQWLVPYVRAMDLRHCTSDRIAREECEGNDEGRYAYAGAIHCESVRVKSRLGCTDTCPISLRSLEYDAAAGVMSDMTVDAKSVGVQEHSNEHDAQPPEKKPYKIPNAMVPPRFVAANMRNSSPPDMIVHGIITVHRRL
jgi:hypothetical protein